MYSDYKFYNLANLVINLNKKSQVNTTITYQIFDELLPNPLNIEIMILIEMSYNDLNHII